MDFKVIVDEWRHRVVVIFEFRDTDDMVRNMRFEMSSSKAAQLAAAISNAATEAASGRKA